jgi:hypothetical protein
MPPPGAFDQEGAREVSRTDKDVTLEIKDNLNQVLSQAVQYGVLDLEDHPFTLEEIFMAYYGRSGGNQHD